ncbi:hypothetical protein F0L74_16385 [Chitinophaga agrisoli]|uniref:Uncharacterized protein n=1 Tax=Chitinophaga agrisoli TaxID=2607653 RepID=A0A5B2VR08_9BACT|nr:hypothetical protein [Chitinophaga agrisoli]KAA2241475.1 hypothetical protein F0L74_16385 [Chitinophaga agrisoli]
MKRPEEWMRVGIVKVMVQKMIEEWKCDTGRPKGRVKDEKAGKMDESGMEEWIKARIVKKMAPEG